MATKIGYRSGPKNVALFSGLNEYDVMRLYLFVWPKSLLIVNYIIKSLYSMVKINLEYFHLFKNLME